MCNLVEGSRPVEASCTCLLFLADLNNDDKLCHSRNESAILIQGVALFRGLVFIPGALQSQLL